MAKPFGRARGLWLGRGERGQRQRRGGLEARERGAGQRTGVGEVVTGLDQRLVGVEGAEPIKQII